MGWCRISIFKGIGYARNQKPALNKEKKKLNKILLSGLWDVKKESFESGNWYIEHHRCGQMEYKFRTNGIGRRTGNLDNWYAPIKFFPSSFKQNKHNPVKKIQTNELLQAEDTKTNKNLKLIQICSYQTMSSRALKYFTNN